MVDVGVAFLWREGAEGIADFVPELVNGSGGGFSQQGLELGEDLIDGIEIGTRSW